MQQWPSTRPRRATASISQKKVMFRKGPLGRNQGTKQGFFKDETIIGARKPLVRTLYV
jgi:hypothetical protein